MAKQKPNTKISASRAYELSDSLRKTSNTDVPGERFFQRSRRQAADREKSQRLKSRADKAVEKAGGIPLDYRFDSQKYDRSLDRASINKAAGRDMPLPSSSQLFDA